MEKRKLIQQFMDQPMTPHERKVLGRGQCEMLRIYSLFEVFDQLTNKGDTLLFSDGLIDWTPTICFFTVKKGVLDEVDKNEIIQHLNSESMPPNLKGGQPQEAPGLTLLPISVVLFEGLTDRIFKEDCCPKKANSVLAAIIVDICFCAYVRDMANQSYLDETLEQSEVPDCICFCTHRDGIYNNNNNISSSNIDGDDVIDDIRDRIEFRFSKLRRKDFLKKKLPEELVKSEERAILLKRWHMLTLHQFQDAVGEKHGIHKKRSAVSSSQTIKSMLQNIFSFMGMSVED